MLWDVTVGPLPTQPPSGKSSGFYLPSACCAFPGGNTAAIVIKTQTASWSAVVSREGTYQVQRVSLPKTVSWGFLRLSINQKANSLSQIMNFSLALLPPSQSSSGPDPELLVKDFSASWPLPCPLSRSAAALTATWPCCGLTKSCPALQARVALHSQSSSLPHGAIMP